MTQILYTYPEALVFAATLLMILLASGVGLFFGARAARRGILSDAEDPAANLIQSAMLTLLSLLLAFGISMADLRYEARKQGEMEEANAIGTAYLRGDFLREPDRAKLKELLKEYLRERIGFYRLPTNPAGPTASEGASRTQREIWDLLSKAMLRAPTIEKSLLAASINESFDLAEKQAFAFQNRVPLSIIELLYLSSAIVSGLLGFLQSGTKTPRRLAIPALALMITLTLFVTLDLDRPYRGLIRIAPDSLLRLSQSL